AQNCLPQVWQRIMEVCHFRARTLLVGIILKNNIPGGTVDAVPVVRGNVSARRDLPLDKI
ncbi:MAG: hypothetical protein WCI94_11230, partial [Rhodospirillales bacterium]